MRQIVLIIILLMFFQVSFSQKKIDTGYVEVENFVEFYKDSTSNHSIDAIKFILKVTNKTKHPIPDLSPVHSENINFYINGKVDNPLNLYNGRGAINGTILPNTSQTFITGWTLRDSGFLATKYGNEFTVQWEYMRQKSIKIKVDIEKKAALPIRNCLVANK